MSEFIEGLKDDVQRSGNHIIYLLSLGLETEELHRLLRIAVYELQESTINRCNNGAFDCLTSARGVLSKEKYKLHNLQNPSSPL